jgi:hypothetical protein
MRPSIACLVALGLVVELGCSGGSISPDAAAAADAMPAEGGLQERDASADTSRPGADAGRVDGAKEVGSSTDGADKDGGADDCNLIPPLPTTSGPTVHVAPGGNDSNDGSPSQPLATLGRALIGAMPGLRVLLGDGTYPLGTTPTRLSGINGTASQPIVITAEVGAHPVFDGGEITNTYYDEEPFISFSDSSYIFVDSIEIVGRAYPSDVTSHLDSSGKYTGPKYTGSALGFLSSSFCTLTRSTIHQIPFGATTETGSDFTIAGCTFYDIVLENMNGERYFEDWWPSAHDGGWILNADGSFKSNTFRRHYYNNTLRNSWGEGYNCNSTDGCFVIGNTISQTFSTEIYMDHARNVQILRNLLPDNGLGGCCGGTALSFDNEYYGTSFPAISQDNILIADNYFGQTGGFALFRYDGNHTSTDTWSNVHVVNNVFAGGGYGGVTFDVQAVQGSTAPHDGLIAGNVFLGATQGLVLEDAAAWTVRDNYFAAAVPSITAGVTASGNTSQVPNFVGPTDGTTFSGFELKNASAMQVAYDPEVPLDALCRPRSTVSTAAGALGP